MAVTYGELFAGYDGLGMGVRSVLGGETRWVSEIDKAPSRILAHHYPNIPNLGDITAIDFTQVEPVDVITGGFPCQDVSHAGRRAGLIRDGDGRTRSGLWGHMLRAVATIRPRLVVAENVRGLLSAKADSDVEPCPWCMGDRPDGTMRALGAVLADLADVGYDAAWYGLRAADVGAAHARFRVFIFAVPADADDAGLEGLTGAKGTSPAGRHGHPQQGTSGPDLIQSPDLDSPSAVASLLPTPAVNDMGAAYTPDEWDQWTAKMKAAHRNGNGHGKSLAIEAQRLQPTPTTSEASGAGEHGTGGDNLRTVAALLPTPRATDGTKGGPNQRSSSGDLMLPSAVAVEKDSWGDYEAAIARHEAMLGRPAPAPTEPGKNGRPRLSPRFAEWLMCLPDGHVTDVPGLTRNDQLKALGNGVVPMQAAAATRAFVTDTAQDLR